MQNLISFLVCWPNLYLEHKITFKKYLNEQQFGHFSSNRRRHSPPRLLYLPPDLPTAGCDSKWRRANTAGSKNSGANWVKETNVVLGGDGPARWLHVVCAVSWHSVDTQLEKIIRRGARYTLSTTVTKGAISEKELI